MEETPFGFRFVRNGQAGSVFAKKGALTSEGLKLENAVIPFESIGDTTTRDNRLIIALANGAKLPPELAKAAGQAEFFALMPSKITALELERRIDRACAQQATARNKERLQAEGKGHLFRTVQCPDCQSTIDLSELEKTMYTYCRFCETVFSDDGAKVTRGTEYRVCDQCMLFDRVRPYTEFYFYFLLVVYGFSYKRRHLCDVCAGSLFWKVFAINFIFVLGVFPALWLKAKSMSGRRVDLKELADANRHAKAGRVQQATPIYAKLHERFSGHPGILMNEGLGHLYGKDAGAAVSTFEKSLRMCSNYQPTVRVILTLKQGTEEAKPAAYG